MQSFYNGRRPPVTPNHGGNNGKKIINFYETPFPTTHLDFQKGGFEQHCKTFADWFLMSTCVQTLLISVGGYGNSASYAMLNTELDVVRQSSRIINEENCTFETVMKGKYLESSYKQTMGFVVSNLFP